MRIDYKTREDRYVFIYDYLPDLFIAIDKMVANPDVDFNVYDAQILRRRIALGTCLARSDILSNSEQAGEQLW